MKALKYHKKGILVVFYFLLPGCKHLLQGPGRAFPRVHDFMFECDMTVDTVSTLLLKFKFQNLK